MPTACGSVVQFRLQAPQCWTSFIVPAAGTSSTLPLQSLSMPSQISAPPFVSAHSQPSAASLFAFRNPLAQAPSTHRPALQERAAWRNVQCRPHPPQLSTSMSLSVSSSI